MRLKKGIITLSIIAASVFSASGHNGSGEKYMHLSPKEKMKIVYSEMSFVLLASRYPQLFLALEITVISDTTNQKELDHYVIKEGTGDEVFKLSENGNLAIHINGAKGSKRSAKEYAEILAPAFANRKYTDKPVYVTIVYTENGLSGNVTGAMIYMDEQIYIKGEKAAFTPEQIGGAIQIITNDFVNKYNGADKVIPLVER